MIWKWHWKGGFRQEDTYEASNNLHDTLQVNDLCAWLRVDDETPVTIYKDVKEIAAELACYFHFQRASPEVNEFLIASNLLVCSAYLYCFRFVSLFCIFNHVIFLNVTPLTLAPPVVTQYSIFAVSGSCDSTKCPYTFLAKNCGSLTSKHNSLSLLIMQQHEF